MLHAQPLCRSLPRGTLAAKCLLPTMPFRWTLEGAAHLPWTLEGAMHFQQVLD